MSAHEIRIGAVSPMTGPSAGQFAPVASGIKARAGSDIVDASNLRSASAFFDKGHDINDIVASLPTLIAS